MFWLSVAAAVVIALLIALYAQRQKQRATVAAFRSRFPHIARLRLVAACPGLDGVLQETELRMLFDWIMLQLHGRTHTSSYGELMQWTTDHGEAESLRLIAELPRRSLDRIGVMNVKPLRRVQIQQTGFGHVGRWRPVLHAAVVR